MPAMPNRSEAVLVIDDSRTMAAVICRVALQAGFTNVTSAQSGAEALTRLRVRPYGLLIADWEMQPMSGLELIRSVRRDLCLADLPIILTTAYAANVESGLGDEADALLLKPFTLPMLFKTIEEAFAHNRDRVHVD